MRAIVLDKFGGPEVLHIAEVPTPEPKDGEVLIRNEYAGVNPADWKCREGWLSQFFDYKFPFIVGFDGAGTVAKVGAGVTAFREGDRVYSYSNQGRGEWGSYAQYMVSAEEGVQKIPDTLQTHEAASVPTAALTCFGALFDVAKVAAGQTVFINGGAGGVGSFAIQFCKGAGARVITTCGPANIDYVKSLGADAVVNYRSEDVIQGIRAWAPGGVDLVLDTVGLGTLPNILDAVRDGGQVVRIATLAGNDAPLDEAALKARGITLVNHSAGHVSMPDQFRRLTEGLAAGKWRIPPVEIVPWDKVADAHTRVKDGHVRGKIVLKID